MGGEGEGVEEMMVRGGDVWTRGRRVGVGERGSSSAGRVLCFSHWPQSFSIGLSVPLGCFPCCWKWPSSSTRPNVRREERRKGSATGLVDDHQAVDVGVGGYLKAKISSS